MSPKASRPADEPEDETAGTGLPPGYVPLSPPKQEVRRLKPVSVWWKVTGAVVVAAGIVIAIVLATRPADPRESVQGMADVLASALTGRDLPAFQSYVCDHEKLLVPAALGDVGKASVVGVRDYEDVGSATLTAERRPDLDLVLLMDKRDESWCVVVMTVCPRAVSAPRSPGLADSEACRNRPGR